MEFKLPKKQVFFKLTLASVITLLVLYLLSAFFVINNRKSYDLSNTTWISRENGTINFIDDTKGNYKDIEEERIYFTYEQSRGYILCTTEDYLLFELVEINEERLFSVNTNMMFYNLESLSIED